MKRFAYMAVLMILSGSILSGQGLKPYTMGAQSAEPFEVVQEKTLAALDSAGFTLLGDYQPAGDETRWVYVINSPGIIQAVQKMGDLTGFASALRVALTQEAGNVEISYTNPLYLGNAYFQGRFGDVEHHFILAEKKLKEAMTELGEVKNNDFGAEEGIQAKKLRHYHYMFGMEYFEDVVELAEFDSYSAGKKIIEANLAKGGNTQKVFSFEVPGKELTLYGIALGGEDGEPHFLPIIDINSPRHTAFLPYEMLLMGDKAVMLHGRYRIALAFPDLTMTTFSKIMSTPGDIEDLMRSVTE